MQTSEFRIAEAMERKVRLPRLRVFVWMVPPHVAVDGLEHLLDFNQRALAATLDEISSPVVFLGPDDFKYLT